MADEEADAGRKPVKSQPDSVVSGRTVEQVAAEARPARVGGDEDPRVGLPADAIHG
jgi:hypothetical protein